MLSHIFTPGVVCCKRQFNISVKLIHELLKVPDAAADVLARVENIFYAQCVGGSGHQLHETFCPAFGNRLGIVPGLRHNNRLYQGRIDLVSAGHPNDDGVKQPFLFIHMSE